MWFIIGITISNTAILMLCAYLLLIQHWTRMQVESHLKEHVALAVIHKEVHEGMTNSHTQQYQVHLKREHASPRRDDETLMQYLERLKRLKQ